MALHGLCSSIVSDDSFFTLTLTNCQKYVAKQILCDVVQPLLLPLFTWYVGAKTILTTVLSLNRAIDGFPRVGLTGATSAVFPASEESANRSPDPG